MKKLLFWAFVLTLSVSTACKKDKKCPAFNDSDLTFVPYSVNDTIKFTNEQDEEYDIYIESFNKTEEYNYECRNIERVCPCTNSVDVIVTDSKISESYTFLQLEQSDVSNMQYYKYQVADFYFEFDFLNELPNINDFEYITLLDSAEIGNKWYKQVVVISNFDNPTSVIFNVFFNQADGILKFTEKNNGSEWSLVN